MYQRLFIVAVISAVLFVAAVSAQTTAFTYQGRLTDSSLPATGIYQMQFALFDTDAGGTQIGTTVENTAVSVMAGVFTVQLDFNAASFPGTERYLEISVRHTSNDKYTVLTPRQRVTSAPYAVRSVNAASADNSAALGGIAASEYVQNNDLRLTDARNPLPSSNNYIQNTISQQVGANFNIGGTGSALIFDAGSSFNIRSSRVFTVNGASNTNTIAGVTAGQSLTPDQTDQFIGGRNTFFGINAGKLTSTGCCNSFFGAIAGSQNTTGRSNVFIGDSAGLQNSQGSYNTFVGTNTGGVTTGTSNTLLGYGALASTGNLSNATAIGAQAVVSTSNTVVLGRNLDKVEVPGNLDVSGDITLAGSKHAVSGEESLRMLRGDVGGLTGASTGVGYTVTKLGTGDYGITFLSAFSDNPTVVVSPSSLTGGVAPIAIALFNSPTSVRVWTYSALSPANRADANFSFIAIGPR